MEDDLDKDVADEARSRVTKKRFSVGLIVVAYLVFLLSFSKYFVRFVEEFNSLGSKYTYSISMAAVAMIIAGTYFYAYRFFKENFYFYLFISWVANAAYLIPELNGPKPGDAIYRDYKVGILILSLISSGFMWLAIRSPGESKPARASRNLVVIVAAGMALIDAAIIYNLDQSGLASSIYQLNEHEQIPEVIGAGIVVDVILLVRRLLATLISWRGAEDIIWLARLLLPAQVVSFVIIWRVGDHIHARLGEAAYGGKVNWIRWTFRVYALLQFIYPFAPLLEATVGHALLIPFLVAQVMKVINAVLMMGVLQSARDREIEAANYALDVSEEKLKRRNQLAELGALAASIKHDITTPLATMGGHIQKIKERFQHNKEIISKMEKLEHSMDRIAATVDVVDIVRGDTTFYNRDKFMEKASMLEVVHRAVRSVKDERPPMLPRTVIKIDGREVFVRAFVPMLEQVVVNVIKNSLEAIGEAGRERGLVTIHVNTAQLPESRYPRWVKVEVVDNGCGIPQENVDKLTTLFTTRNDKKPNSGIGLFMAKKIMGIHGGRIRFESTVGVGTAVTLLLPEWNALQKVEQETHVSAPPEAESAPPAALEASAAGADTNYKRAADVPRHSGGAV